jgi:hypothetical protein
MDFAFTGSSNLPVIILFRKKSRHQGWANTKTGDNPMKKLIFSLGILASLAAALFYTGSVFAQSDTPPTQPTPGSGWMMGGRGMKGAGLGSGILHDDMVAILADELGLSVDELNQRLADGETMVQVALSTGLTADQVTTLMTEARSAAIDQAVAEGTLTQEQADLMQTRGGMMGGRGRGRGMGTGGCPMGY